MVRKDQFQSACALIGMVHLRPLPGSPGWDGSMEAVLDAAARDARALLDGGVDGIIVENMGDLPYIKDGVAPETIAAMTLATAQVVAMARDAEETLGRRIPVGVQVLAAANREALGVALASGADFIRVEGFAYAHVADEGWIDACAGPLLRARRALGLGPDDVAIWADVQKKHAAHAVTADLSIADLAHGALFCGADALIVTGTSTGTAAQIEDVQAVRHTGAFTAIGSGITDGNARLYAGLANALIVGSWLKEGGDWRAPVDVDRVRRLRALMG